MCFLQNFVTHRTDSYLLKHSTPQLSFSVNTNPKKIKPTAAAMDSKPLDLPSLHLNTIPHLTDTNPNLTQLPNPIQHNQFYNPPTGFYISKSDIVLRQTIHDLSGTFSSPISSHLAYLRAGPRQNVYFNSIKVKAAIVNCGGLCPGMNTVIRELVVGLSELYGVNQIYGIRGGYRGFYSTELEPVQLSTELVHNWHKRGGTVLQTSRGGFDLKKIVDAIQFHGFNQVSYPSSLGYFGFSLTYDDHMMHGYFR